MYQQGQPPPPGQYPPPPGYQQGQPPPPGYQQGQPPPPGYQQGQPPPPGQYPSQPGMQQHPSQYSQGRPPPPGPAPVVIANPVFNAFFCAPMQKGVVILCFVEIALCLITIGLVCWDVYEILDVGLPLCEALFGGEGPAYGFCVTPFYLSIVAGVCVIIPELLMICLAFYLKGGADKRNPQTLKCWMIWAIIWLLLVGPSSFSELGGRGLKDQPKKPVYWSYSGLLHLLVKIYQFVLVFFFRKECVLNPVVAVTRPPTVMTVNQGYPAQQMSVQQQQGGYPQQQGYPQQGYPQQQPGQEQPPPPPQ